MSKKFTAESLYEKGKYCYIDANLLNEEKGDPLRVHAAYNLGAGFMGMALALGHFDAPYSLSVFFNRGVGVKQDKNIAKLLYGVALQLGDNKCKWDTNKQIVPKSMIKAVDRLTQLIKAINEVIPSNNEIDLDTLNFFIKKISNHLTLPDKPNEIILNLFQKNNEDGLQVLDQNNDSIIDYLVEQQNTYELAVAEGSTACCVLF